MPLKTLIINDKIISYKNFTLRPNFQGFEPPYLVSFIGPADITKEGLCDLDDIKGDEPFIKGYMLHFIGEWNCSLEAGVWRQLKFTEILRKRLSLCSLWNVMLECDGNDIYVWEKKHCREWGKTKLTVSIVSPSVKNTVLFHFGINIKKVEGYPFAYLEDEKKFIEFNISSFAGLVIGDFEKELKKVIHATKKVRKVKVDGKFIS